MALGWEKSCYLLKLSFSGTKLKSGLGMSPCQKCPLLSILWLQQVVFWVMKIAKLFIGSSSPHGLTRTEHWNYFSPDWQPIMESLWDLCLGVAPGQVPVRQASARGLLVWGPGSLCDRVWSSGVVPFGFMACPFVVWTEGKVAEYWYLSKAFLYEEGKFSWSLPQEVCSPSASL